MSGQKSKSTVPKSTVSVTTSRTSTSNATQPRRRMVQNYLVIWVDGNIDENTEDCRNTLAQLRAAVSEVNVCTTPEGCIDFLNKMDEGKAFVISSGALGQSLVNDIHGMPKVDAIYIFCGNKARHEPWAKDWPKIRGVFTSIKPICESLKKVARECDHDSIPMSFVPKRCTSDAASNEQNLNELPPTYMYSVIFKDIVLEINDDDAKSIKALETYCKKKNIPNAEINELKSKYHQKSPVWWYTCEMFLYGMLNCGLRSLDMEAMSKLGFFIRSLHLQLKQLHQQQSANFRKPFTVYRGQGMTKEDFQNLLDSKGGLLSFNNFLSTIEGKDYFISLQNDSTGTLECNIKCSCEKWATLVFRRGKCQLSNFYRHLQVSSPSSTHNHQSLTTSDNVLQKIASPNSIPIIPPLDTIQSNSTSVTASSIFKSTEDDETCDENIIEQPSSLKTKRQVKRKVQTIESLHNTRESAKRTRRR
ncbi:unnamed protein product [Rotaria magnacalcarata]